MAVFSPLFHFVVSQWTLDEMRDPSLQSRELHLISIDIPRDFRILSRESVLTYMRRVYISMATILVKEYEDRHTYYLLEMETRGSMFDLC